VASSVWLLACIVMSSAMLSPSSFGASSFKMANRLLLYVCCWCIGSKRRMFEGTVGSCNVVGIRLGLRVGGGSTAHGGATLRALACIWLNVGTLGSDLAGYCGHSTLGDRASVASRFLVPWWRFGILDFTKFLKGLCAYNGSTGGSWDCTIEGGDSVRCLQYFGVAQCIGYSHHVLAPRYCLVPGIQNCRHQ
jgi:hypothetical protein